MFTGILLYLSLLSFDQSKNYAQKALEAGNQDPEFRSVIDSKKDKFKDEAFVLGTAYSFYKKDITFKRDVFRFEANKSAVSIGMEIKF